MARSKPAIVRLRDLEPGQSADFFALLAERAKGATRDGKAVSTPAASATATEPPQP